MDFPAVSDIASLAGLLWDFDFYFLYHSISGISTSLNMNFFFTNNYSLIIEKKYKLESFKRRDI